MAERLIDAEAIKQKAIMVERLDGNGCPYEFLAVPLITVENFPTIEAKEVVHAHWISASWEEDEENGIENTYSDEFICSNCKEHLYFPDAIEKEDLEFSFCPYCGAQMDEEVEECR